jgi:hypothetical protein
MTAPSNGHHVLFERYLWTTSKELNKLRSTKELIPRIGLVAHRGLHSAIEQVPIPDHHMLRRMNREFYPEKNDTIGSIRNLQESVGIAMDNPYVSDLAVQVGLLIMGSLELQIPFIEQGYLELDSEFGNL